MILDLIVQTPNHFNEYSNSKQRDTKNNKLNYSHEIEVEVEITSLAIILI